MKVLVTGNLGYVGPAVVKQLRVGFPKATLIGFDTGFFQANLTGAIRSIDTLLDIQYYGDVRKFPEELLHNVDAIVHLAAISNDPIGNQFEKVTLDVNYNASVTIAEMAKKAGVKTFVFASSCSVYGAAESGDRKENSQLNPLTAYARSKVLTEEKLMPMASDNFKVTCLRFATACGMSERLRLDLVLNDFVAGAILSEKIDILSDGSPWRPLIDILDMARAIEWAIKRPITNGGNALIVNTGNNSWNYQVADIAAAVKKCLPHISVSINKNSAPDKRSYKVNFDLYHSYAGAYAINRSFDETIGTLVNGIRSLNLTNKNFRTSNLIRLNCLNQLREQKVLDENLFWV